MTKPEALAILGILKTAYPNFYKDLSKQQAYKIADFWSEMFANDDAELVTNAVKAFITTDDKGFPPVIGVIKNKIADIKSPDAMTEYEAWNLVKKAVSNGIYGASEEYAGLPPLLQRLVGSPNKLREWAVMDSGDLEKVIGSNFMRSYSARAASEREYSMLPEGVKRFISELSDRMSISADLPRALTEHEISEREISERRIVLRQELEGV